MTPQIPDGPMMRRATPRRAGPAVYGQPCCFGSRGWTAGMTCRLQVLPGADDSERVVRVPPHVHPIGGEGDLGEALLVRRLAGSRRPPGTAVVGPEGPVRPTEEVVEQEIRRGSAASGRGTVW